MVLPYSNEAISEFARNSVDLVSVQGSGVADNLSSAHRLDLAQELGFRVNGYPITSIVFPDGAQLVMIGTLQIRLSFA